MITALTALFVLVSFTLVVTVPVALATPGEWESSKDQFNKVDVELFKKFLKF